MSEEQNRTIVLDFLHQAYNEKNVSQAGECLTEDLTFFAGGKPVKGVGAWKQFANGMLAAFPDLDISIVESVAEGDRVAVYWTCRATHDGPLRGIPASGKGVAWDGLAIYELSEGKISRIQGINDMLGILQQIGAIPS
jgi:steroid delta-isomerase-like uncharacterized protein